mgnify:CR=1 FL=1
MAHEAFMGDYVSAAVGLNGADGASFMVEADEWVQLHQDVQLFMHGTGHVCEFEHEGIKVHCARLYMHETADGFLRDWHTVLGKYRKMPRGPIEPKLCSKSGPQFGREMAVCICAIRGRNGHFSGHDRGQGKFPPMKRAKPLGLGASCKRSNVVAEDDAGTDGPSEPVASGRGFCTLPDDATALDQVKALYDAALQLFLQGGEDDGERALQLFHGVANECLRMETVIEGDGEVEGDAAEDEQDDLDGAKHIHANRDRIFTAIFYFIFGDALAHIAYLSMHDASNLDEITGYLQGARHNLLRAVEMTTDQDQVVDIRGSLLQVSAILVPMQHEDADLIEFVKSSLNADNASDLFEHVSEGFEFMLNWLESHDDSEGNFIEESLRDLSVLFGSFDQVTHELKLLEIDARIRLALALEYDVDEADLLKFSSNLREISTDAKINPTVRRQTFLLLGSICEMQEKEAEAAEFYDLANEIQ